MSSQEAFCVKEKSSATMAELSLPGGMPMTYLRFHLIFNLPLLVILAVLGGQAPWDDGELAAAGWFWARS